MSWSYDHTELEITTAMQEFDCTREQAINILNMYTQLSNNEIFRAEMEDEY